MSMSISTTHARTKSAPRDSGPGVFPVNSCAFQLRRLAQNVGNRVVPVLPPTLLEPCQLGGGHRRWRACWTSFRGFRCQWLSSSIRATGPPRTCRPMMRMAWAMCRELSVRGLCGDSAPARHWCRSFLFGSSPGFRVSRMWRLGPVFFLHLFANKSALVRRSCALEFTLVSEHNMLSCYRDMLSCFHTLPYKTSQNLRNCFHLSWLFFLCLSSLGWKQWPRVPWQS